MIKQNRLILGTIILTILTFLIIGLFIETPLVALKGFLYIQVGPARLLSDFIESSGIGGALINSSLVGAIGLLIILLNKVKLSGPTFAAVLTLMGFGLFGKTVFNIIPILSGVYIAGRFVGKEFKEYIIIALFGTALGPIISFTAFELGLPVIYGIPLSIIAGLGTGFLLPGLAVSMLHLHQGYNLYNMGLTCGFLGLFLASIVKSSGHIFSKTLYWYKGDSKLLLLIVPAISLVYIIIGFITGKKKALKDLRKIQRLPGRLPSDFMDMVSTSGALINAGLIGLLFSLYIYIIGGDFNGPVIGGLLTIIGFSAFGTHLRNSWAVVLGVVIASLVFGKELNSPGVVLAAIFVTTLSPLSGQFGIIAGIIGGFLHLTLVIHTSSWHGGMNLYNNGFAGGLSATIIIAFIQWYKTNKVNLKHKFRSKYE